MEVDPPEGSTAVTNTGATDQAVEKAADELGEILAHLEDHPQNVPYLRRQIYLLQVLGLATEARDAILKLSSLVMLDEGKCQRLQLFVEAHHGRYVARIFRHSA